MSSLLDRLFRQQQQQHYQQQHANDASTFSTFAAFMSLLTQNPDASGAVITQGRDMYPGMHLNPAILSKFSFYVPQNYHLLWFDNRPRKRIMPSSIRPSSPWLLGIPLNVEIHMRRLLAIPHRQISLLIILHGDGSTDKMSL